MVAFEPPVSMLLDDREALRALGDDVDEAYRTGGAGAAMAAFTKMIPGDHAPSQQPPPGEPTPEFARGDGQGDRLQR